MCLGPLGWLAVGLGGASVVANNAAARKDRSARKKVMRAENARQQEMQDQASRINKDTIEEFDRGNQEQNIAAQAQKRERFIQEHMPDGDTTSIPVSEGAPMTVKSDLGKRIADALSYGRGHATRMAKLGSYGANQFDNNVTLGRAGIDLGRINNTSQRSQNIAQNELMAANSAGDGLRTLGDVFRLGSMGAGIYGMTAPATAGATEMGVAQGLKVGTGPNLMPMGGGQGFNMARSGLGLRFTP